VIVALVTCTVLPLAIVVVPIIISVAVVPTVKPVATAALPDVQSSALAADPPAEATTDKGRPFKVSTPAAAAAAAVAESGILARIPVVGAARAEVPITRKPLAPIAVVTASSRVFFNVVLYTIAMLCLHDPC
jgi:hypothetical protein